MAFCNSCGATLNPGTKFCNKCGAPSGLSAPAPGAAPAPPTPRVAAAPAPPSAGGGGALKIILIVVAVIVVVGVLVIASLGFFAYRVAKNARVHQEGDHVKVETPFGNVESSKDPAQAEKDLGIDIYPGAQVQQNGATTATFMGVHTVTANFDSSDSLDKVCTFYKSKFPNAMSTTSDQNQCNIISNDHKNMVTIKIEANGDGSKFQITNVTKPGSN
ncbi:MAG TPA: zinc ribbon domain-containing protein [Candidatus Sulfotelmatobacter sp.]|jgi:flagellar basal body-associated protein FliL|nr:zinc ribbon domain-containing protein [Candidatus Sulfotelmatobacter sp.]